MSMDRRREEALPHFHPPIYLVVQTAFCRAAEIRASPSSREFGQLFKSLGTPVDRAIT